MDKVEFVILDLTPVPHIDSMGCHFLEELNEVRLQQQMRCMQSRTLLAFMNRSDVLSCNLVVLYCVAAPGEMVVVAATSATSVVILSWNRGARPAAVHPAVAFYASHHAHTLCVSGLVVLLWQTCAPRCGLPSVTVRSALLQLLFPFSCTCLPVTLPLSAATTHRTTRLAACSS